MSPEGDDALNAKFRLGNHPSEKKQGFSNSLRCAGISVTQRNKRPEEKLYFYSIFSNLGCEEAGRGCLAAANELLAGPTPCSTFISAAQRGSSTARSDPGTACSAARSHCP